MPPASARLVRTAFLHLVAGFLLGSFLLAFRGQIPPAVRGLHREVVLVGWLLQLALGVAWWIFPKYQRGPPRGAERTPTVAWVLLNLGIALVTLGTIVAGPVAAMGRVFQILAVGLLAAGLAPRVKPFGV